ncbi:BID domain-containing T4SS effector [Bartonella gliris]|uniref:BID domain-containing T4SS effector n=1 Tax=Bartonella gliris TaxID=3004109 RepID=UPI003873B266
MGLAANPTSFHQLAGRNICGFKTHARRHAENGLSHLTNAVENYASAVKRAKEDILQRDQERQNRQERSASLDKKLQKQQELSHPSKGISTQQKISKKLLKPLGMNTKENQMFDHAKLREQKQWLSLTKRALTLVFHLIFWRQSFCMVCAKGWCKTLGHKLSNSYRHLTK